MSEPSVKRTKKVRKPLTSADISPLLEKAPPHDYDAERAVLGALLRNPDLCDDVIQIVRNADEFYFDPHCRIYKQIMQMRGEDRKIDLLLLVNRLSSSGDLEAVGGMEFLAELMEAVPITAHAEHYAGIVKEKSALRKLIHAGSEILQDAYAPEAATKELLNKAAMQMAELCESQTVNQITDMAALMNDALAFLHRRSEGEIDGIKTGFVDLDNIIDGLHPNELVILAARPGVGKTAMALNIAEHAAVQGKNTVLFVSLEMARVEVALRLISSRGRIDSNKIRRGFLSHEERDRFMATANEYTSSPLYIDDTPSRTVAEIAAVARKLQRQQDLKLLVVDYLGLITPDDPRDPRQEQVAKIARRLKTLARELHVPILCLAQLNRQADTGKPDDIPRLSQLRESGAIEQDADVVLFIHREKMKLGKTSGTAGDEIDRDNAVHDHDELYKNQLIVAKQRNGATGIIDLVWLAHYTRFLTKSDHNAEEYGEFARYGGDSYSPPMNTEF